MNTPRVVHTVFKFYGEKDDTELIFNFIVANIKTKDVL